MREGIFQNELALQQAIAQSTFAFEKRFSTTYMRREVPVAGRIPDLVYVGFSVPPDSSLVPNHWAFRHSYIIWLLRKWISLTVEQIADYCFASKRRITKAVRDLTGTGALEQLETGEVRLSQPMNKLRAEVVAVEAKLYRWREALSQGMHYSTFADQVIVAMDALLAPTADNVLELFQQAGIGLCAVGQESHTWLVPPMTSTLKVNPDKEYLVISALAGRFQTEK